MKYIDKYTYIDSNPFSYLGDRFTHIEHVGGDCTWNLRIRMNSMGSSTLNLLSRMASGHNRQYHYINMLKLIQDSLLCYFWAAFWLLFLYFSFYFESTFCKSKIKRTWKGPHEVLFTFRLLFTLLSISLFTLAICRWSIPHLLSFPLGRAWARQETMSRSLLMLWLTSGTQTYCIHPGTWCKCITCQRPAKHSRFSFLVTFWFSFSATFHQKSKKKEK